MSILARKIGAAEVSSIGFGAMGLSAFYGPPKPDEERFKVRASRLPSSLSIAYSWYPLDPRHRL